LLTIKLKIFGEKDLYNLKSTRKQAHDITIFSEYHHVDCILKKELSYPHPV